MFDCTHWNRMWSNYIHRIGSKSSSLCLLNTSSFNIDSNLSGHTPVLSLSSENINARSLMRTAYQMMQAMPTYRNPYTVYLLRAEWGLRNTYTSMKFRVSRSIVTKSSITPASTRVTVVKRLVFSRSESWPPLCNKRYDKRSIRYFIGGTLPYSFKHLVNDVVPILLASKIMPVDRRTEDFFLLLNQVPEELRSAISGAKNIIKLLLFFTAWIPRAMELDARSGRSRGYGISGGKCWVRIFKVNLSDEVVFVL
ncbi:hypothetical protein BDP27DRAFT_1397151 [Rhodocollybia butyracea]|uniref:Uncharacterized protein n=1 Tax=Rhodocollybia butyracea TaxID=206335 RepID=A0A9P5QCB0_9AGAR|nr:hypothetical protein BDP27DRAFT_1397151 [Rhodocollybia butyracea]